MFDNAIYIGRECPICGCYHEVLVYEGDYIAWEKGELLAQEAFPYLAASEREILMSGICRTCWIHMFD